LVDKSWTDWRHRPDDEAHLSVAPFEETPMKYSVAVAIVLISLPALAQELPPGIEVRLGLIGGNGSGDADLDPRLYQRVVKDE
jgi:hypothetical protein